MKLEEISKKTPRATFRSFVYGSLFTLLVCLLATAFLFSETYLDKERARAKIADQQLKSFFDFQYRPMTEEMWTQNFEAIQLRVESIAHQMGGALADVILVDEHGKCVYSSSASNCDSPKELSAEIPHFQGLPPHPVLRFDPSSKRHIYMTPLYVGAILKGYLYATTTDPYGFYRGGSTTLMLRIFSLPIICVLVAWLVWLLVSQRFILRPYLLTLAQMEKQQALGTIASQVAHDIRSPLAALSTIGKDLQSLPEDTRILMRSAVERIQDIANQLLTRHRQQQHEAAHSPSIENAVTDESKSSTELVLLPSLIELLLTEKRVQYRSRVGIEITSDLDPSAYGLFAQVVPVELKRLLSNLINNSVESFDKSGRVSIALIGMPTEVILKISDNGRGIPPHLIPKLGQLGQSCGKATGSGLGLYHAKSRIEEWNGHLEINSQEGVGTTITLRLPRSPVPDLFASRLSITPATRVVVLDDDSSIHQIWGTRFASLASERAAPRLIHFSAPDPFVEWVRAEGGKGDITYLIDYELIGHTETGLDLIKGLGIAAQSLLVTSHFEESEVQTLCQRLGVRLVPKGMAGILPIELPKPRNSSATSAPTVDAVLVDDDPIVHLMWKQMAAKSGKRLLGFHDVTGLRTHLPDISPSTPIYLDQELGDGQSGEEFARELYEQGFAQLYLVTGHPAHRFSENTWIKGVRGKEAPWAS